MKKGLWILGSRLVLVAGVALMPIQLKELANGSRQIQEAGSRLGAADRTLASVTFSPASSDFFPNPQNSPLQITPMKPLFTEEALKKTGEELPGTFKPEKYDPTFRLSPEVVRSYNNAYDVWSKFNNGFNARWSGLAAYSPVDFGTSADLPQISDVPLMSAGLSPAGAGLRPAGAGLSPTAESTQVPPLPSGGSVSQAI